MTPWENEDASENPSTWHECLFPIAFHLYPLPYILASYSCTITFRSLISLFLPPLYRTQSHLFTLSLSLSLSSSP